MKFIFTKILFLLLSSSLYAYTINGTVIDKKTKKPVSGMTVGIEKINIITTTDSKGNFYFKKIVPGKYKLHFSHLLYGRQIHKIKLKRNFKIVIKLKKKDFKLKGIENYYPKKSDRFGEQTITNKDIKTFPMRGMGDSLHLLQTLPGIGGGFSFATVPIIRGGNPLYDRIYVDDIPIDYPYHYFSSLLPVMSAINETVIDRATVNKGLSPMYHDDNLGNTVQIKTKIPEDAGFRGKVIFDPIVPALPTFHATAVPVKGLNVMLSVRRSFVDLITDFKDRTGYLEDHYVKVSYNLFEKHRISFVAIGADDYMRIDKLKTQSKFNIESFKWEFLINKNLFLKTLISLYSTDHLIKNSEVYGTNPGIYLRLHPVQYRIHQMLNVSVKNFYIKGGYDLIFHQGMVKSNVDINEVPDMYFYDKEGDIVKTISPIEGTSFSLFADGGATFKRGWLNLGVKYKYYGPLNNHSFNFRTLLGVEIIKKISLYAGGGMYSAHPDMYYYIGEESPDFKDSKAYNVNVGMKAKIIKGLYTQLELYYSYYTDLTTGSTAIIDVSGYKKLIQLSPYSNEEEGYSYGVEFLLKGKIKNFYGWISYAYSVSKRSNNTYNIHNFNSDFNQSHILRVVLSATFGRFTPSLTWHLYSSLPYSPITGTQEIAGVTVVKYGDKNSERYKPHHRLDLKLTYTTKENHRFYIEIWNAYYNQNNKVFQAEDNRTYMSGDPDIQTDFPPIFLWLGMELCF